MKVYRVWNVDKECWWKRFMSRDIYKTIWYSVEEASNALESAEYYKEHPPIETTIVEFKLITTGVEHTNGN